MAKNKDSFFGGLFDFNGDGETDIGEEFTAYQILKECFKKEDTEDDDKDDFLFDDTDF